MLFIYKLAIIVTGLLLCHLAVDGRTTKATLSPTGDIDHTTAWTTTFDLTVKVIIPCTPQNKMFFVTDGTNTFALVDKANWPKLTFAANDILHVKGLVQAHGNLDCLSISVIGKGRPEPITDMTLNDLINKRHDWHFARVHGTVRSARQDEIDPKWAFVTLYDKGNAIQVSFMPSQEDLKSLDKLVGAKVSVCGITLPQCWQKGLNRRFTPASLTVRSLADFTVLHSSGDPFLSPPLEEADVPLSNFVGEQQRSTTGHVLAVYGGSHVVLCNDCGDIINVDLSADAALSFGTSIRVAGYPATDLYRLNLTDAVWRPEPAAMLPLSTPKDTSLIKLITDGFGRTMIKPTYHGQAIRIHGIVRTHETESRRFVVESEQRMIAVDVGQCPDVLEHLEPNCEVEVSGICVMPTDNWYPGAVLPRIREVFVALRTADDLRILSRPPWWTPQRLLLLIAALIVGLAVITVWNRLLKHKIERRSRELLNEQIAHVTAYLKTMERTRLAIELHDSLAQNLTGVALQLQTVGELVREDAEQAAEHLETANRSLLSCREELRNCLRDLRSEALETDDINKAIRLTLDPHVENAKVSVRFNVPRNLVTDNTLHAVLRIIRELVLNAIRHGHASEIKVAGAVEDWKLLFSVSDNGRGFDPVNHPGIPEGHFGLQGIHERVKGFAGELKIVSSPGHGAKVTIALKLPKEDDACNG